MIILMCSRFYSFREREKDRALEREREKEGEKRGEGERESCRMKELGREKQ